MNHDIQLISIPDDGYREYKYKVIFDAYKWDPQVEDHNTVSKHVAVIGGETACLMEKWAEQLAEETMQMEEALLEQLPLARQMKLPRKICKSLENSTGYRRGGHVRLMRFDFHPTAAGWAISEVNSDVPGGLAEASILPQIAGQYVPSCTPYGHTAASLLQAYRQKADANYPIAFVHATSYADDRQVMQFLADYFEQNGFRTVLAAPDHLRWNDGRAISIVDGYQGELGGVVRFFPLEWLLGLPRNSNWQGYFGAKTPSCNHPVAMLTQSKRLPLVWNQLGVDIPTWKKLLPATAAPGVMRYRTEGWILKPALGRVGDGISIKDAITEKEMKKIYRAARRNPSGWVAQKMFTSCPLTADSGETFHLCLGVFAVDGKFAGFYGRISPTLRIDEKAKDIPVLVAKEGQGFGNGI